jgi:rubredoxin
MKKYLDKNPALTVPCPSCGYKFKKSFRGLQRDFKCPSCGFGFKADQFAKTIEGIEKELRDLARTLK